MRGINGLPHRRGIPAVRKAKTIRAREEYRGGLQAPSLDVIVYRSGLTKGTGVLSGARRIDVTMSITRIPL